MFERFTGHARRAITLSQDEARLLGHDYIATGHLLLGLLREGDSLAALALQSLGIRLADVRQQVREITGHREQPWQDPPEPLGVGQPSPSPVHLPFTPQAQKVLDLALREAIQLGHDTIGTEHILLGLAAESDGEGAEALVRLGVGPRAVRQRVTDHLRDAGNNLQEIETDAGRGLREYHEAMARMRDGMAMLSDILAQLHEITERLTAIERHLGMGKGPGPATSR